MAQQNLIPSVEAAYVQAMRKRVVAALGTTLDTQPLDEYATLVAEVLTWDALEGATQLNAEQRATAKRAFALLREVPSDELEQDQLVGWQLRAASLAVLSDVPQDGRKLLAEADMAVRSSPNDDWLSFTRETVWKSWLGILRHRTTDDVRVAQQGVARLRSLQKEFEAPFLSSFESKFEARCHALELMGFYFLGTAAERLSEYLLSGTADGGADIDAQLDMYFERVMSTLDRASGVADLDIVFLLRPTAHCLALNSVRAATRGANHLTRQFAEGLVSRQSQPLFQLLPPQREALRQQGLATNVHRSVVVNFPTSSGKTLLAQFGILQSLNDLGAERGWVAYVAPTRALVNQVTNRLRRDFASLNKRVERLSPALEFDTVEVSAITARDPEVDGPPVDVLVCTPEKLDLLIRREELCSQLGRLAMVVVDEAHGMGANDSRAIKLELLLSIVNREHESTRFLLLTPFISNAEKVAKWLDRDSYKHYSVEAEWVPNDRIIGIASPPPKGKPGKKAEFVLFEPVATRKATLHLDDVLQLNGVSPELGYTAAKLHRDSTLLSSATAQLLCSRGPTVVLCRTVKQSWDCAGELARVSLPPLEGEDERAAVARFASYELGSSTTLSDLLQKGIGVHNAGLPEELAQAMEWLFENRRLHALCATTTLAQGVNFPIANLVITSIYPASSYGQEMSYADFWNIAGRVGRVDQDAIGVVALAAPTQDHRDNCHSFLQRSMADLASTLIALVDDLNALANGQGLESLVWKKEWSNFSQFVAHTLRQVGAAKFADQVELVLRGTFGYQALRESNAPLASGLLRATRQYAARIAQDMGAVSLVDSTGFSYESVKNALYKLDQVNDLSDLRDPNALFSGNSQTLRDVMGVLLNIPEVKKDLVEGGGHNGGRIAEMLSDWVHGDSFETLTANYFDDGDEEDALAQCVRKFKRLSMTASWGLSSVLAMKLGSDLDTMPPEQRVQISNIPSMVLYGVRTTEQIALRAAGVPRNAAVALAAHLGAPATPYATRKALKEQGPALWLKALGRPGADYFRVWSMLETS